MLDSSPYELNFDEETKQALHRTLCDRVNYAVKGATDRNSDIQTWRDQLEGFGVVAQNQMWENACNLTDPISMQSFLTIFAQIIGASHRDPHVSIEAFQKKDEENARIIESWLSMESSRSNVDAKLYELGYNACWAPMTIGYIGWEQVTRSSREVGYKVKGEARVYTEEQKEEGIDYQEVPISEEVVEERYDIRCVDPTDFFLWPPTASSIDRASAVMERMYLTEDELYDGINDYGYDKDAVEELCSMGSGASGVQQDESRVIIAGQDGLEVEDGKDGYYEIYIMYTRMPRRIYGGVTMADHYMQEDFLVVLCPSRQIVLKMDFSPFKQRPYFSGGILPRPLRFQGHALMALLEPMQTEANANIQLSIDAMNIGMCQTLLVPDSEATDFNKYKRGPGAVIPIKGDPRLIIPIPTDTAALREGLAWQADIRNRSQALVSAEGQGQLQPKVRKQGEIDNINQQVSAKFGMYLSNYQRTVVAELFRRMILLKEQFGGVDEDDGEEFVDMEGNTHKLTLSALRGKYNVVAGGTSLTHSPEARAEIAKQKQSVQSEFLLAKSKLPPDIARLLWHGARELLVDLGERNPEAWIGEEPAEAPQAPENGAQGQAEPFQNGLYPGINAAINGHNNGNGGYG